MPPSPEIFGFDIPNFGHVGLRWYSVMIVLGALVASWLSSREARRRGQDSEHIWQMLPVVLIAGIIGARLGWVLVSLEDISNSARGWLQAIYITDGGLSIQGAVVGGILALTWYTRRHRLDFFEWTDIIVPGLALAQAIGRWGNFFNQEAFGGPCDYPWCIPIDVERQAAVAGPNATFTPSAGLRFHPTFAYEMIWDLINFGILMWLGRQRRFELRTGDLLWAYGIIYSLGRFFIEEIRIDSATVGGVKAPTVIALLTIIVCWAGFIWRHRPGSDAPVAVTSLPEGATYEDDWDAEDDTVTAGMSALAADGADDEDDYDDEELTDEDYDDEADDEVDEAPQKDPVKPTKGDQVTIRPTARGS